MKLSKFFPSLLLTGAVVVISYPASSKEIRKDARDHLIKASALASKNIPKLSEVEHFFKRADVLVQTPAPNPPLEGEKEGSEIVAITSVKANPTEKGLEVILQTAGGEQLQVANRSTGNNFIADVSGGQLRLPSGEAFTFRSEKPLAGITEITVTNINANTVRVTVVGEKALPTVELFDDNAGLVFGVASAATAIAPPETQPKPEQEPVSEAPQEKPEAQQDEPIELVVTGERDGYSVPNATTATRTDTPLRDIPQSIQVVPRQVIEDQKVTRVGDALQNVSGVTNAGLYNNYLDYIWLRGFPTFQGNFFRNGVRLNNYYTGGIGTAEIGNLERVEVLKGPASILFGSVEPGGIINLITKSPLSTPYYSFDVSAGSYDKYRGAIDFSGPLNEQKTILYRLNAIYDNSGSFRDFVDSERISIAPTISFAFSPQTTLKIDADFSRFTTLPDSGIPAVGDRPAKVPRNRSIDEPFGKFTYEDLSIGYTLNHKFSENWSLRNLFRFQSFKVPEFYNPLATSFNQTTGVLQRGTYDQKVDITNYSIEAGVIGKFSTGSILHQLLLGFDYNNSSADRDFDLLSRSYPSLNIFNPIYARQRYSVIPNFFRNDLFQGYGFYIQDQVTISPQFKLLLGGRFDTFIQSRGIRQTGRSDALFEQTDSKFTPRVGVVYQPSDAISLYASYASSFQPSLATSRNPDASSFAPTTGTQYEVGVKTDFLNSRLSATLAGFILDRQNVPTPDPNNRTFSILTGEQTSKGIELDVSGEILPGWNIIASVTYLDARVSKDNRIPVGNRLLNAAETSASLWTTYRLQSGDLKGLGFGLGMYYAGDRPGDLTNSFVLPSYFRTDAALYYERDNWRAALNVRNLFDVTYFSGSSGSRINGTTFGEPLAVVGSFSIKF